MKPFLLLFFSFSVFSACSSCEKKPSINNTSPYGKIIVAYVHGWEDNWGENFEKAKQITHINYAFANIKDGRVIEGGDTDTETLIKLNTLKQVNKELKILISIGGWTWSNNFSDAVLTESSREIFANSAIAFMQKHNIDGIDLDWEYPGQIGDGNIFRPEDKENFTAILKLLREKLDALSTGDKEYLLTIATAANQSYLDHTNMREAHKYLDFINIMTYDFHTGWGEKTGHNANLGISEFNDDERKISAQLAVEQHINAGIPTSKIVLGVPFYGRWWNGVNPENNGLYQAFTGIVGSYNYNVISDSLDNSDFTAYWDDSAKVPYIWRQKDSLFISYDNAESITCKVDFVKSNQLGGIMFWQFNGDNGTLLKTIFDSLHQ